MNYLFKPQIYLVIQIISCIVFLFGNLNAQNNAANILKVAGTFHKNGSFDDALQNYSLYLEKEPGDDKARMKLALLYIDFGYPDGALSEINRVIGKERNVDPVCWYLKARALHQKDYFDEAGKFYKRYLQEGKEVSIRSISYYFLNQVGVGVGVPERSDDYFLENLGNTVNSPQNEIRPVYSPNVPDKIYFSSSRDFNRSDITIGEGNFHRGNFNMYSSSISQGIWANIEPMNDRYFSHQDEVLLDFNRDGMVAFVESSGNSEYKRTWVDSVLSPSGGKLRLWNHPGYDPGAGDRDLYLFNDSTILFASDRDGGYGGYDLYVSFKKAGRWSVENLGPQINSRFHEISPFLTRNGKKLFFSSDSEKSMGGYDIFSSAFSEDLGIWENPENLLKPINSGMDEINFRISLTGEQALFSSNRPGGEGQYDLYGVFYDHPVLAQLEDDVSSVLFTRIKEFETFRSDLGSEGTGIVSTRKMEPIYYKMNSPVLSGKALSKLDELLKYYQQYPHINFLVKVYSEREDLSGQSLFQSYLKGSEVAEYLVTNGVSNHKIKVWTLGGQYPGVKNTVNGDPFLPGQVLNRRIEIQLLNTDNLPVSYEMQFDGRIESKDYTLTDYRDFKERTSGLYYRVRFIDTKQVYRGTLFNEMKDALIEKKMNKDIISYYVGIYPTFDMAKEKLFEIRSKGYKKAEIVAFDNMKEIGDEDFTAEMMEKYPDLKKYLIYLD